MMPLRVLCLHGFRTSASILKFQCRDLPADLLDLTFIDGTFSATGEPEEVVKQFFSGPYYEWFNKQNDVYVGLPDTLKYIRDYAAQHGPFDGVLGFSQGGSVAAYLTVLDKLRNGVEGEGAPLPNLKFALLFSGFVPRAPDVRRLFPEEGQKIDLPVFCCHGKTDFVKTDALAAMYTRGSVHEHSGGHELPHRFNGEKVLQDLRQFLQQFSEDDAKL